MFSLFKKRAVNVVPINETDNVRLLKARITRLEAEVLDIATAQDIIRNKVLRKIQTKRPKDDENSEDYLTEDGFLKTN